MVRLHAIVAGTNVIPAFGRSVLNEEDLHQLAEQLRGEHVPMFTEHDLDRPIEATVVRAEVRDGPDEGEHHLYVEYDVPDEHASGIPEGIGMSIGLARRLVGPEEADAGLFVDPHSYSQAELAVALQRLSQAGFTPAGGVYLQLAVEPPSTVVFDFALYAAQTIGWAIIGNAIYDGLKVLVRRGERTRFRFRIHRDKDSLTAEVQTSSEAGLKAAIKALRELEAEDGGLFVREAKRWRKAGTGKRARPGARKNNKKDKGSGKRSHS